MTAYDDIPKTLDRPVRPTDGNVPATRAARERLLSALRDHARQHRMVGPVPVSVLSSAVEEVLTGLGMDPCYDKYSAVLLNNEVWRETVAGIDYSRRLLLLPQCLRNTDVCQADVDDVGLACRGCGSCHICDFQTEAQRLGYVVLVAEGSPVVMSLIQSGQIDAVIGVSCLNTLQEVHPYMEAAAIPALAIPLLQDGCSNTSIDTDWLWDAIYLSSIDQTRRMNLEAVRRKVNRWFEPEVLEELLGPSDRHAERIARDWLACGGKRWRPFLAVCTARALSGNLEHPCNDALKKLAVGIECFHKASLIHDDIEDDDTERYGRATLHTEYGIPIALNAGDLLLGEGYRLIGRCGADESQTATMLRIAADGHHRLCVGQGQELAWARSPGPLSLTETLDIFRLKTSPAFHVALSLGAIQAGADASILPALETYAESLGIAYQIRDDLDDASSDHGRPSIIAAIRHESRLDQNAARDRATHLLDFHKHRAISALQSIENVHLKSLLRRVVTRIFNDVESMNCCTDRDDRPT